MVDRAVVAFLGPEVVLVGGELDHQGAALEPGLVQLIGDRPGVGQLGIADRHPAARRPGLGDLSTRQYDDAPTELGWSGMGHRPNLARGCAAPAGDGRPRPR